MGSKGSHDGAQDEKQSSGQKHYSHRVALLGDSTFDNIVWVNNMEDCVPVKIKQVLLSRTTKNDDADADGVMVLNYAADGFTSSDVLHGAPPAISWHARIRVGDPFPTEEEEEDGRRGGWWFSRERIPIWKPLERLKNLREEEKPTHVVLSVGGNDVREILGDMHLLHETVAAFHHNYRDIIDFIRTNNICDKIVIMLQYRPCLSTDESHYGVYRAMSSVAMMSGDEGESSLETLNSLMEQIYAPILTMAQENGYPVIDLARTFDPHQDDLYVSQIEPSAKGGTLIAEVLSHAIVHHNFNSDGSKFYFKESTSSSDEVIVEDNDGKQPWKI